jgi:RHS repeat-associated protein
VSDHPYGDALNVAGTLPKERFTGQQHDAETGLEFMNARSMQARTGRMNQPDPLFGNALVNPQRWNRYAYVVNNPLKMVDPTGMEGELVFRTEVIAHYADMASLALAATCGSCYVAGPEELGWGSGSGTSIDALALLNGGADGPGRAGGQRVRPSDGHQRDRAGNPVPETAPSQELQKRIDEIALSVAQGLYDVTQVTTPQVEYGCLICGDADGKNLQATPILTKDSSDFGPVIKCPISAPFVYADSHSHLSPLTTLGFSDGDRSGPLTGFPTVVFFNVDGIGTVHRSLNRQESVLGRVRRR